MNIRAILSPLKIGRLLTGFFVLTGFLFLFAFVISSLQAVFSDDHTVKLELDTHKPHQFPLLGQLDDVERSYADGLIGVREVMPDFSPVPREQVVLNAPKSTSQVAFSLVAENRVRWLRYVEPNPWKRLGLYYVGASDQMLSLLKVLYYALGSWLLYRMLRDATEATPFTMANARRLEYFSLLIIFLSLAPNLMYGAVRALLPPIYIRELAQPMSHYVVLNTDNQMPGATMIVALAVIAFIYRRGVELHQEAELTV